MSKSNVNQASGAAVKRSCDSGTAIMLGKTGNTNVSQAPGAAVKRRRVIGQSEYPDFVFTKLSDAIREWQETGTSKAHLCPIFQSSSNTLVADRVSPTLG